MKYACLFSFSLFFISTFAMADHRGGLNAAPVAIQYIMADPPLPASQLEKGKYRGNVKPGYLSGDFEGDYGTQIESGDIKGPTMGGSFTYAMSDKWGMYAWFVGTKLKGDFSTRELSSGVAKSFAQDVKVDFYNLSAGFTYLLSANLQKKSSFSLFGGLYLPIYNLSQRYINQNTGREIDADIESDGTFVGMLFGIQWQRQLTENWGMGSFFILADTFGSKAFLNPFGDSGECKSFKVTNVRSGQAANSPDGDEECGGGTSNEFLYDTQVGGLGINLTYYPWDLSFNLSAPFFNRFIFKVFYEDVKPNFVYLSLSWGFGD